MQDPQQQQIVNKNIFFFVENYLSPEVAMELGSGRSTWYSLITIKNNQVDAPALCDILITTSRS